jgi:hypothetical protein
MTDDDYYNALAAADWNYEYSDDAGVYRAGYKQIGDLFERARGNPKRLALFSAMREWGVHGGPKPARL